MVHRELYSIFKSGSRTYFCSSLFFPRDVKEDVFVLYAFVRTADNFVDSLPQQKQGFYDFKNKYRAAERGEKTGNLAIDLFVEMSKKRNFERSWIDAFLHSMELDLFKKEYETLEETEDYMYGSAEVVGLMMARILGLSLDALPCARHLGKAMQYINFIRDIAEDIDLGRTYLPQSELRKYKVEGLDKGQALKDKENFKDLIRAQIALYDSWQAKAEEGYKYIPKRYLIPIKTAADMYKWTAGTIKKDPFIVYERKVKPAFLRIFAGLIKNSWR